MSDDDDGARRELPARPSIEHLRKQAKRLARRRSLDLAAAQRALAREYGSPSWADLRRRVAEARGEPAREISPLAAAARAGDAAAVRELLAASHPVDGAAGEGGTPLWYACAGDAPPADRIAAAAALLAAGASARRDDSGATPLHAAAARGPLAMVELLIRHGALEWQPDRRGRSPLDAARRGRAADRAAIAELLDRPVIRDPSFRAAVAAIHAGDAAGLARLLDAEPRLLRERIVEPDCYREAARHQYFRDPKLFWFIANNPILTRAMPTNMAEVAQAMIARGADRDDLVYALELVMTGSSAREHGLQIPLLALLLGAGALPTSQGILMTLGHRELEPIQELLDAGHPMTAPIAAALGSAEELAELLRGAPRDLVQDALSVAVVNQRIDAARVALDAGADPNAFMSVHSHSTPLHQAALSDDTELLELLIARGARADIRDTMWNGTPLGWAVHEGKARARARLEELASDEPR
jgi:ankyrin repeat protein